MMIPDTLWILIAGILDDNAVEVLGTFPDRPTCERYANEVAGRALEWTQDNSLSRYWYGGGVMSVVYFVMVEHNTLQVYQPSDPMAELIKMDRER